MEKCICDYMSHGMCRAKNPNPTKLHCPMRAKIAEVEADLQEMVELWDACMCREKCLTAERDRYKAALEEIINHAGCDDFYHNWCGCIDEIDDIARTALKGER